MKKQFLFLFCLIFTNSCFPSFFHLMLEEKFTKCLQSKIKLKDFYKKNNSDEYNKVVISHLSIDPDCYELYSSLELFKDNERYIDMFYHLYKNTLKLSNKNHNYKAVSYLEHYYKDTPAKSAAYQKFCKEQN